MYTRENNIDAEIPVKVLELVNETLQIPPE